MKFNNLIKTSFPSSHIGTCSTSFKYTNFNVRTFAKVLCDAYRTLTNNTVQERYAENELLANILIVHCEWYETKMHTKIQTF